MRRRGKNLLLSPIDWAMIEGWQERGVPLHVVIRGIETVFDGFEKNPSPRTIKGLLYCREEIEAQYQEWLAGRTGDSAAPAESVSSNFDRDAVRSHIERAISMLRSLKAPVLREAIDRACGRLGELAGDLSDDFETVDKSLCDVENLLDNALLNASEPLYLRKVEDDISSQLRAYKNGMDPESYNKTFRLMQLKRLRDDAGIPRLSLFYL